MPDAVPVVPTIPTPWLEYEVIQRQNPLEGWLKVVPTNRPPAPRGCWLARHNDDCSGTRAIIDERHYQMGSLFSTVSTPRLSFGFEAQAQGKQQKGLDSSPAIREWCPSLDSFISSLRSWDEKASLRVKKQMQSAEQIEELRHELEAANQDVLVAFVRVAVYDYELSMQGHPDIKNVAHAGSIGSEIAYNIVVRFGVADSLFVVYEEGGKGLFINGKNDYYLAKDPRGTWIIEMEPNDALIFATYDGCGLGGQGHCVPGTNENTVLSLSFLVVLREHLTLEQFVVGKLRPALTAAAMVGAEEPAQNEITLRCSERAAYMAMMIERAPGKPNPFNFQARSRSEKLETETAEQAEDYGMSPNEFVWFFNVRPSFMERRGSGEVCTYSALSEDYGQESYFYHWWNRIRAAGRGVTGTRAELSEGLLRDIADLCGEDWLVVGDRSVVATAVLSTAAKGAERDEKWQAQFDLFREQVAAGDCAAAMSQLKKWKQLSKRGKKAPKQAVAIEAFMRKETERLAGRLVRHARSHSLDIGHLDLQKYAADGARRAHYIALCNGEYPWWG